MLTALSAFYAQYKARVLAVAIALVALLGITVAVTVDLRHREHMASQVATLTTEIQAKADEIAALKTRNQTLQATLNACALRRPKVESKPRVKPVVEARPVEAKPAEQGTVFGWHRR